MKTTVHKLNDAGDACMLCGYIIPPHNAAPREFVGVVTGLKYSEPSAYRIGSNNQDALCNGQDADTFHQESRIAKPAN